MRTLRFVWIDLSHLFNLTSRLVWIFGEARIMTILAWSLKVRDFTGTPRERQRQPSLGGYRPLGMAAVAAPSVCR